ncbi:glycosyltransferase family 4 protein [Methylobacillus sp.]|uniref:glycosyltransferase family 4 protein n=1 Tax=Methylobacillus sp. TaxID=56818 RepID=UPI002FE1464C
MQKNILVVQRRLTHYRIPFFEAVKKELEQRGYRFSLAYGDPTFEEREKQDSGDLAWAERLDTRYFLGGRICWQPFWKQMRVADVIVVTAENKLVFNLYAQYFYRKARVALWGHGANLQGNPSSWRERFKRLVAKQADWWFGYTAMSLPLIEKTGFPCERVTILNNAVDTTELGFLYQSLTAEELGVLRSSLGLQGGKVGIYVGSLYREKMIPLLLSAAKRIREKVTDFELIIVGAGPEKPLVEEFCQQHEWAHYLGVRKGRDKVAVLALANVMLNPGLVGLGILDSFVCAVPIVTTDCGLHSPEVAYLEHDGNGLMVKSGEDAYVEAVSALLQDTPRLSALVAGCRKSAELFTVENMAKNFADGAIASLEALPFRKVL